MLDLWVWKYLSLALNCLNYCRRSIDVCLFAAFAIEGQVKEKSKWFSSLRDLTRKLKVLTEYINSASERKKMLLQLCLFDNI